MSAAFHFPKESSELPKSGTDHRLDGWGDTAIGPVDRWPPALKSTVGLMLDSQFPMFIAWGPALCFLYNDAYTPLLQDRHPSALGEPLRNVWPELWNNVHPIIEKALAGEATFGEDVQRTVVRNGRFVHRWYTLSYTSMRDDDDMVVGVFCVLTDTTARVLLERRQAFHISLAACLRGLTAISDIISTSSALLGCHFNANKVGIAEVSAQGNATRTTNEWVDNGLVSPIGALQPLDEFGTWIVDALQTGQTVAIDDASTDERMTKCLKNYLDKNVHAALYVPLFKRGRLSAISYLQDNKPRQWDGDTISLFQESVEHIWVALEHARAEDVVRDLNDNLEQLLRQRTAERDRLWTNSMDLLLVIGTGKQIQAVNPAWTSLLGYHNDELVGRSIREFIHPEDLLDVVYALGRSSQGPLGNFEMRLRHKDHSYRWTAWRAACDEGIVYANGRDITIEKRQAILLAQASETRLRLAMEAGEMGAWEWDCETDRLTWLDGAAALHGQAAIMVPDGFSLNEYVERYVHPADRDAFRFRLTNTLDRVDKSTIDNRERCEEYRIKWTDGTIRWLETRWQNFGDEVGVSPKIVGISVDMTRRKRAEDDLVFLARASEELAGLIHPQATMERLATLSVPTFADWCTVDLIDDQGELNRVAIAHVDPAKIELIENIHRRFLGSCHGSTTRLKILNTGQAVLTSDITDEMLMASVAEPDYLEVIRDMGLRSYIGVPLTAHGKILGVVTFITAESRRRYGPDDLALAEDLGRRAGVAILNAHLYRSLQESDHAKDMFLATLAHELRNPLSSIMNGLMLLNFNSDDQLRVQNTTRLMTRQASQLRRLVDDLMDSSRISTGKIELKKEAISLNEVLQAAIEANQPAIDAANLVLEVKLLDGPNEIFADPVRLGQVFSNLLNNATKFTPEHGRITIRLRKQMNDYIVSIRDTGIGIDCGKLDDVFQMFTQLDHPLKRTLDGLGIGLSLVKGLVHMHDGTVRALSEGRGQGCEFVVQLPSGISTVDLEKHLSIGPPQQASALDHDHLLSCRILVVDDNRDAADSIAEILRMLGSEVVVAYDGESALKLAAKTSPNVVLLDIGLPDMNGYEVATRMRRQGCPTIGSGTDSAGTVAPVLIALTGWGQEEDLQRAVDAGFNHHWLKPVGLEKLRTIEGLM